MIKLLSTLLLAVSFLQLVLSTPLLRRRSLDKAFFQHQQHHEEEEGGFLIKHHNPIAADNVKLNILESTATKLNVQQTMTGDGETRFGNELAVTTLDAGQAKRVLVATQGEVNEYSFTDNTLATTTLPSSVIPNFTTPITKIKAYKNWLLVSSSSDNDTRGIVLLYNLDSPSTVYPPIRGSWPGDYLGKSLDITVDDDVSPSLPLIVVGGDGFVSTYRLDDSTLAWLPVGGGALSSDAGSIDTMTGDGFGSQVAFGKDSSGAVLLYIASPLHDKRIRRKMTGRIQVYTLSQDETWQEEQHGVKLGRYRNGKFGSTMTSLENLLLVSTPYYKEYKGAATLYWWNSNRSKLRKQIKLLIEPSNENQVLFGTSLGLYKNDNEKVYMGVGSIHSEYNVGVLQVLLQEERTALFVAGFMEDNNEETCGVSESFALVAGEGDSPDVIAGGPYCDEVYVLG